MIPVMWKGSLCCVKGIPMARFPRFVTRSRVLVALGGVAAMAVVGGIAYATIPGPDGVIHGCYSNKNGALRVIDSSASCKAGETALNFNQTGPQGATGPQGVQGEPGLVWRGTWNALTSYVVDDAVEFGGSSYVAVAPSVGSQPPSPDWNVLASQGATGPQGVQGEPGLVWRGTWNAVTSYVVDDAVEFGGSSYVAVTPSVGSQPPSPDWDLLASRGATGPPGPPGDTNRVHISWLGATGRVDEGSSITIVDGFALISYQDSTTRHLEVARCEDIVCSAGTLNTVDSDGNVGADSAVTIGGNGLPLISYRDSTTQSNSHLKIALCADVACSSAEKKTLDAEGDTGYETSITVDPDGRALISYFDRGNADPRVPGRLRVAHCDDVACSSWTTATLDTGATPGPGSGDTSIARGSDGLGLIAYRFNGTLKIAHCDDVACSSAATATLDSSVGVGSGISMAIGADERGLISYRGGSFKVAHCDNVPCSSSSNVILQSTEPALVGQYPSVTIGGDGLALISYRDAAYQSLKVAHCSNAACSSASTAMVDAEGEVGNDTSLARGTDGLPLISYFDESGNVKVAHCTNALCVSYFRRR